MQKGSHLLVLPITRLLFVLSLLLAPFVFIGLAYTFKIILLLLIFETTTAATTLACIMSLITTIAMTATGMVGLADGSAHVEKFIKLLEDDNNPKPERNRAPHGSR